MKTSTSVEQACEVAEALRKAKRDAVETYGVKWNHLEEISRFELFTTYLTNEAAPAGEVDALRLVTNKGEI